MKIGKITDELKELIVEQNDLREVAADYGVIFNASNKAKCPFHDDGRNGNLHLFEKHGEDPSYYCFAETCGAGTVWSDKDKTKRHMLKTEDGEEFEDGGPGVIGFVMNIEQCSFVEACIILMGRAGIPIPQGKTNYKHDRHKKRLSKLNLEYCKNLFRTPDVLDYVLDRGITKASIKKWRLGYINEDDESAPMGRKVSGRLVFGLREESYDPKKAATVAMAYRTLKDEQPKYYNDYTVEGLYEKKFFIYGLNEARKAIRKAGYAIVTEGYTDVIIAHQSELENTIATCGTAFTYEQMEKLRKLTKNLVFWYDGDGAGWDAMVHQIPELLSMGFRVKIVAAPEHDPAEWMLKMNQNPEKIRKFVAKHSKSALTLLIEEGVELYQEYLQQDNVTQTRVVELRIEALDYLLPILDSIVDRSEHIVFKSLIEQKLKVRI